MIDILCYYDQNHKILYDLFFYPSYEKYLKNHFNLIPYFFTSGLNEGDFQSDNWYNILFDRYSFLIQYIENNPNKWAIFSDVDVLFLGEMQHDISTVIDTSSNHEIFYTIESGRNRNNTKVKAGFFLFKCTDTIKNYFSHIQKLILLTNESNDQEVINKYIHDTRNIIPFNLSRLPFPEFATNNNPSHYMMKYLPSIKMFHATCTSKVIYKIQVLSTIQSLMTKSSFTFDNLWIR